MGGEGCLLYSANGRLRGRRSQLLRYSQTCQQVPYNQRLRGTLGAAPRAWFSRMADSKDLHQIVERAVAQVIDHHMAKLRAEIVRSVMAELPSMSGSTEAVSEASPVSLVQAVANVHAGSTQKEILRALLDSGSNYAARVALFVVKAGAAN